MIRHVIAEIALRRGVERTEPDGVHPETGHVIQPSGNAREVAHAIAIRVEKAAQVDLIDHRATPPGGRIDVQRLDDTRCLTIKQQFRIPGLSGPSAQIPGMAWPGTNTEGAP